MPLERYLDPQNNVAFKMIFGTEKHKKLLIHFLNDILGNDVKISDIEFLKTSKDPEISYKKQSVVDVLCKDEKGERYIVEMLFARSAGFEERAQYYAARAYVDQMKKGGAYEGLKRIIFLAITDFVMFPNKADYKSDHVTLDKKNQAHDLKAFSFTFIELPKFNKTRAEIKQLNTLLEKWCYFFKYAPETTALELQQLTGTDIVIKDAYEVLDKFGWSDEELLTYDQETKRQMDEDAIERQKLNDAEARLKEAETYGLEKGMQLGIKHVASGLLAKGHDIPTICELTGLSEAELIKLKETK
ncbi:MAG: Rpn family recombination-promoting nuclease/putative transposase [Rickettsiales bacterium]